MLEKGLAQSEVTFIHSFIILKYEYKAEMKQKIIQHSIDISFSTGNIFTFQRKKNI